MKDRIFHWVRNEEIADWLACGWVLVKPNAPMHHNFYSFFAEWLCDCPMRRPK